MAAAVAITPLIISLSSCAEETPQSYVPEGYDSWPRTIDEDLRFPIPGHMDNMRRIYINPKGLEYETEMVDDEMHYFFPEGTVIVKEVYQGFEPEPDEGPRQLTVMVKQPEHPKALGGWLWIVKNPQDPPGEAEQIITNEFCLTCHSNANESHPYDDGNPQEEFRDYVFYLPQKDAQ